MEQLLTALPESTRATHENEIRRIVALGLPPAISLRTVATLFGVSSEFIGALARVPNRYYRVFKIKKGKKTRTIHAPKVALKLIQSWFGSHVANNIALAPCVFGFVPNISGVKSAAAVHCGSSWVYSLDLRDFFPSISKNHVVQAIKSIGYGEDSAQFLAKLLTLDGYLPQGSPASPVLSNLVFSSTDKLLMEAAEDMEIKYTRYADDLVFSGTGAPPEMLKNRIRTIVENSGWTIANDKEYFASQPARLKVHGLLVHGEKPRLTKGYRNRIRAYQHLLANEKILSKDLDKVKGHLSYAKFIDK